MNRLVMPPVVGDGFAARRLRWLLSRGPARRADGCALLRWTLAWSFTA